MLKNYLNIAIRHISRNKSYVIINVAGLGIALACCMIAFINYQDGHNADNFHKNYDRIYQVLAMNVGFNNPSADISAPLVINATEDFPGVEAGVRYSETSQIVQYKDAVFGENVCVVDPNFLDVFTFNIIKGDKEALKDPSKILISEKKAKKYFGDSPAIGEILRINPGQEGEQQLVVGGVFEDIRGQSSCFGFEFLTHISFLERGPRPDTLTSWKERLGASFVLLKDPSQSEKVTEQINQYIAVQNEVNPRSKRAKYLLQPMSMVFLGGGDVNNNNSLNEAASASFYWGPWVMALMLLIAACLNFTNTTISFSNKRLKEMGVRKVMGGGRIQLMLQLLGESLVICMLALGVAIILAEYLTPLYNQMWADLGLELTLNYLSNPGLILFLVGIVLVTTLLGGAYPAFYISSFQPSHIFRGNAKFGGDGWLVRSLLGFQIIISLVCIIGGITFAQNASFQKDFDLGYNVENIINVSVKNGATYEKFKNVITENPDIKGIAGSRNNLGFGNWWSNIGKEEDNNYAQVQLIGEKYLEVMGFKLVEGRTFDENLETDFTNSVIVNQKFLKDQQWTTALDKTVDMYGNEKKVIGVVEDFYASAFFDNLTPNVFHFEKNDRLRTMKVKVSGEKLVATKSYLENKWKQSFPNLPFNAYYQDEAKADGIIVSRNIVYIYSFLSIVSILLSATGLFSLVSLNVLKRAKEIAVRRILGASPKNITYVINKHYLLVFGIGGILGGIAGAAFAQFLIGDIFNIHQGVDTISVIAAVIGICIIGGLTIGGKIFNVLKTNPAETLKNE